MPDSTASHDRDVTTLNARQREWIRREGRVARALEAAQRRRGGRFVRNAAGPGGNVADATAGAAGTVARRLCEGFGGARDWSGRPGYTTSVSAPRRWPGSRLEPCRRTCPAAESCEDGWGFGNGPFFVM